MAETIIEKTNAKALYIAWLWLILAIITEVIGSSYLKIAQHTQFGFIITALFICVSYYFIGLAIKRISVSVAYAMWEVLGVVCIVLIGVLYFDENLKIVQYIGIGCAIIGIGLINFGEEHNTESSTLDSSSLDSSSFNTPYTTPHNPTHQAHKAANKSTASFVAVLWLCLAGIALIANTFCIYFFFYPTPAMLGFMLVCIAAILDVIANLLLKASQGFSRLWYGFSAVACVVCAFYLLMLALASMELAVAYSSWGAIGIIGTIIGGRVLFGERLRAIGYVGVVFVIVAVGLLHEVGL